MNFEQTGRYLVAVVAMVMLACLFWLVYVSTCAARGRRRRRAEGGDRSRLLVA